MQKLVEDEGDEDDDDDDDADKGSKLTIENEQIVQVKLSTVSPMDMYPGTLGITYVKYVNHKLQSLTFILL